MASNTNMRGKNDNSHSSTLPFIILFFSSMIAHELAMEALSTTYQFFPHMATSITLFQFGFCVLLPLLVSLLASDGDAIKSFPRTFQQIWIYVKLSALVYGATACSTMSLTYDGVTYVTKVVFKSAKLIPTMIVGVVMDTWLERSGNVVAKKKKYGPWEYGSAILLCVGAAGFCMSPKQFKGDDASNEPMAQEENPENTDSHQMLDGHWIGIALLTLSVFCDALVPNVQQNLMHGGGMPAQTLPSKNSGDEREMKAFVVEEGGKQMQQMPETKAGGISSQALLVNTNSIGTALIVLSTIFRGSFFPIISFMMTHPHFLILHLTVGVGLGTAVLAYTELIRRSGPAAAVAVATLRKVVTVILSYIIFPKPMTKVHVFSAGLVIAGLIVGYLSKGRGRK